MSNRGRSGRGNGGPRWHHTKLDACGSGVAGLGRAFSIMLPTLQGDPRVALVAAADPRPEARQRFAEDFGGAAYETVAELCADPEVEVVYVATPHQYHAAHARTCRRARQASSDREANGAYARRRRQHDRGSARGQRPPGRRPQPFLRCADPARAGADRQRPIRRRCA